MAPNNTYIASYEQNPDTAAIVFTLCFESDVFQKECLVYNNY